MSEIRMLSASQVAKRLNLSSTTVRRMCERGDLPHYRIGREFRIAETDLNKYLDTVYQGPERSNAHQDAA